MVANSETGKTTGVERENLGLLGSQKSQTSEQTLAQSCKSQKSFHTCNHRRTLPTEQWRTEFERDVTEDIC